MVIKTFKVIAVTISFVLILLCSSCNDEPAVVLPDMKFNRVEWSKQQDGRYVYREQMVNDVLRNYQWVGKPKDSVVQVLGEPDSREDGELIYRYASKPILGGIGTAVHAVVFEFNADSTVKVARLNNGGFD